ncbi:MAG: right-handed parallel beta-helix repeat-containing protein [Candidatus Berkelbacteria bacterium]|nr:right-handed parallel beta-helix repeat-containing protein [Candidatus Berkelbacteria bacterium]
MAPKAQQVEFLLSQVRNSTGSLASGTVTFYAAGTTTLKTIWTDRDEATPAANPYTLDANGTAQIYASGLYKVLIKNAAGTTIYTRDNLYFEFSPSDDIDALQYSPFTFTQATIEAALTAIGTVNKVTLLLRPGNWVILTALAFPTNVTLKMPAGAYFSGAAVTSALITGIKETTPSMFGINTIPGTTDMTTAIQAAATAAANGTLIFAAETYLVSTAISLPSNIMVKGHRYKSLLKTTTNGINLLTASSKSNITIENISFQGNNSSTAQTDGNAIYFTTVTDFRIANNNFTGFGATASGHGGAIYLYSGCERFTVEGNYIVGGLGASGGSDILVYTSGGNGVIRGNQTLSANSQGIYLSAVTPVGKLVVEGNTSKNHLRHGILAVYGAFNAETVIANNVLVDNAGTGIYISGDDSGGGGIVVTGNIIDSCAGGGDVSLSGGILVTGTGLTTITANYIYNSGKTSAGVTRTVNPGVAIKVNNQTNTIIDNNIIDTSTNYGISAYNNLTRLNIYNNTIINTIAAGIHILSSIKMLGLNISHNYIEVATVDGNGIYLLDTLNDGTVDFNISDNYVLGAKLGTGKVGLYSNNVLAGVISNNVINQFDSGWTLASIDQIAGIGTKLKVRGNTIKNSTVGITYATNLGTFGFVQDTYFLANGTNMSAGQGLNGKLIQAVSSIPRKIYSDTAAPTNGTWEDGDIVWNSAPAVGAPVGWVCTTPGGAGVFVFTAMANL